MVVMKLSYLETPYSYEVGKGWVYLSWFICLSAGVVEWQPSPIPVILLPGDTGNTIYLFLSAVAIK